MGGSFALSGGPARPGRLAVSAWWNMCGGREEVLLCAEEIIERLVHVGLDVFFGVNEKV